MEKLATELAVRMSEANTIEELRALWQEVNLKRKELGEWFAWLTDIKDGNKIRLEPAEEPTWLTKEGERWWHDNVSKSKDTTSGSNISNT